MSKLITFVVVGLSLMIQPINAQQADAKNNPDIPKTIVVRVDSQGNASVLESKEELKFDEAIKAEIARAEFKPISKRQLVVEENEFTDELNTAKQEASWYAYWGWYGSFYSSYYYYPYYGYGYGYGYYYYPYYQPYYYGGYNYYYYSYYPTATLYW